ncbi:ZYRO0C09350p [Zygosaccharomyces rouxii]|uniref:ZYRO0C09350p n=1 Tax=Zygosaccharomyces rouxii (strain ATCC 2623 / CBS 732 / NBRC 1130 / NCYC 568 / NRRL Y-229) TaxID=559307 RepID=C5DTK8_ZYGRC|nr:uncharacterized protein ZYRO0C09350g [Zygosaccharomyces rouxii]KAH9201702.1 hypothetical protein LQ764DRAFT_83777 [Zygosaccharomyces rouxii]CAR27119.1 ZYRO0C09350p [Zygosaccharomyces rouxii]
MESSRNKPVQVHLVTPEEPTGHRDSGVSSTSSSSIGESGNRCYNAIRQNILSGLHSDHDNDNASANDDSKDSAVKDCFVSSVKNTRKLETDILVTIQYLKNHDNNSEIDRQRIVELLNGSLTAISHWSLQAQLAQLRRSDDDRHLVETNLLRKEMEVLMSRRPNEPLIPQRPGIPLRQRQIRPKSPSLSISTASKHLPSSKSAISGPSSPITPQKKIFRSPRKHPSTTIAPKSLVDPASLKLVESKKAHPRMRRTSDNPMTNEYVRVFHLQRK